MAILSLGFNLALAAGWMEAASVALSQVKYIDAYKNALRLVGG